MWGWEEDKNKESDISEVEKVAELYNVSTMGKNVFSLITIKDFYNDVLWGRAVRSVVLGEFATYYHHI